MMKKFVTVALVAASLCTFSAMTADAGYVRGYPRNNGTYVQPHYRSNPNGYRGDNYSHYGNVNPYTGQRGNRW